MNQSNVIKINDNIAIWREFNPIELSLDNSDLFDSKRVAAKLGFNKELISIQGRWFCPAFLLTGLLTQAFKG